MSTSLSQHLLPGQNYDNLHDDGFILLYFSASWCPPCRGFTPQLMKAYEAWTRSFAERSSDEVSSPTQIEVVFVSRDRRASDFSEYYAKMPWLAVDFKDEQYRQYLLQSLVVKTIPCLVVLDRKGNLVTKDGVRDVKTSGAAAVETWRKVRA